VDERETVMSQDEVYEDYVKMVAIRDLCSSYNK